MTSQEGFDKYCFLIGGHEWEIGDVITLMLSSPEMFTPICLQFLQKSLAKYNLCI